jgi:hypothetical protein
MADSAPAASTPHADTVRAWKGHRLDDVSGASVGKIEGAFGEREGPPWLLARMGRFGHYTLVPGRDAVEGVGHVWVPYSRDQIRRAPRVEPQAGPDPETVRALRAHYGLGAG